MSTISQWAIPTVIVIIVTWGYFSEINVFEAFLKGAADGLNMSIKILPALIGLIFAVGIFKVSGSLDLLTNAISPISQKLGMPAEVVPFALLRPISGSGAMVIFNDILAQFGPDSLIGRICAVMEGSTETTFYTIAVYFGATTIKKTRHTVWAALSADLAGMVMSVIAVKIFFNI